MLVQLVAGEQIDELFGAKFGLTTMVRDPAWMLCLVILPEPCPRSCHLLLQASAALGNMVSDVCGVGLAGQIEVG